MNPPSKQVVRAVREKFGLSQTEAAEQVALSLSSWQRFEYGQVAIPVASWRYFLIANIDKLANMLKLEES